MKAWNEVLFATVLTNNDTRTLPLGLYEFQTQFQSSWHLIMAAGVMISVPVIIFFTFLQKHLVTGFTSGAVKG
jgi:multiple sugar transport system permease protein